MIFSWFRSLIGKFPDRIFLASTLLLVLISILCDLIPQVPWVWLELYRLIIIDFEVILLFLLPADYVILLLLLIISAHFHKVLAHFLPYFPPYITLNSCLYLHLTILALTLEALCVISSSWILFSISYYDWWLLGNCLTWRLSSW